MNIRLAVKFAVQIAYHGIAPRGGYMHHTHIMATSPRWSLL